MKIMKDEIQKQKKIVATKQQNEKRNQNFLKNYKSKNNSEKKID